MNTREKRIAALDERLSQLRKSQRRADVRRRHVEGRRHRRADLRRKSLVGAVALDLAMHGQLLENDLRGWLGKL